MENIIVRFRLDKLKESKKSYVLEMNDTVNNNSGPEYF